ncbi:hypothetical protein CPB83DRAFT_865088 [Crepidotus variabilis]|uniref:Uncharacterized protein n=1 Tax=Crepidotus variabilis TaxID=179855 RepID=A0A9P6E3U1_9AGAR|nr:hypothetical protein CPB83DRAFT_865088 [Crepidotus variabilis]
MGGLSTITALRHLSHYLPIKSFYKRLHPSIRGLNDFFSRELRLPLYPLCFNSTSTTPYGS